MNLRQITKNFRRDQDGSMAIELLLVMPILVWALLSTFVYFDLYRVESNANRAALTVADMFSREEDISITPQYLNGARNVLRALTYEESNPDFRATVYEYNEDDDELRVIWSRNRGLGPNLRTADINDLDKAGLLPAMANNDKAMLFQTRTEYDAAFSIGLGPFTGTNLEDVTFETFIVIRPRAGRLCWDQRPADDTNALLCD